MHKRKQPTLRLSLLSCAIALAASGVAQSALAVDICTGDSSISVSGSPGGVTCSLDTANARLTVNAGGAIDDQVHVTVDGTRISNAGVISADGTSAIYYDGVGLDTTLSNSGQIDGYSFESSYAYAYGVYVGGELSGSLSNSGKLRAHAEATGYRANASALDISGDLSGAVTNSGRIEALAQGSDAEAYGILIYGDLSGRLVNSGTISATAMSPDSSSAYASALYISGEVSGGLRNSGTISAYAESRTSSATAYGVYVDGGDFTSTSVFTNSGTIKAEAKSNDSGASAYAVYVDSGKLDTVLANSGTVNATATSFGSTATAEAIYLGEGIGGNGGIVNTGTISAIAKSGDYAYATAIRLDGEHSYVTAASGTDYAAMSGTAAIVNSGSILADAQGRSGDGEAYAVYLSGDMAENAQIRNTATGTIEALARSATTSATATAVYAYNMSGKAAIVNNGLILAQANSTVDYSEATGIDVDDMSDESTILNNKTLRAIASGQQYASAYAIETGSLYDKASIINNGTIEAKAASLTSSATAYGIYAGSLSNEAKIINNGSLTVTAEGPNYSAYAIGIDADSLGDSASIINNGKLTVTAYAPEYSATAYGMSLGSLSGDAKLTNNGTIKVSAEGSSDASAYGLDLGSLSNNAALLNKGSIIVSAIDGTSSAYAYGINMGSVNDDATLTNSGKIDVSAYGRYDAYGYAYGIDMGSINGNGRVTNNNLIRATAKVDGTSSAYAYGIDMSSLADNGVLLNKGAIIADARSKLYQAYAYGISLGDISSAGHVGTVDPTDADDDIAALTNAASGVIAAYAEGDTSASAYGITAGSLSGSASLVNDGSIQAVAVNHFESSAYAYGISTGELTGTASIANNGKIMVGAYNSAQTGDDSAYAYGIQSYIVDAGTSITNAGVIRVQAAADQGSASAYGIRTNAMSGTIENSGTIDVAASSVAEAAYAYGIYAGGTDPYATSVAAAGSIVNTGTINGAVYAGANYFYNCFSGCGYLGSSNINVTNSGSIKTFAEADSYVSGNYTQQAGGSLGFVLRNVDDYGQLYVSGTADFTASNTVKLHVDPKAVFANGDVLNDIIYANTLTAHADGFAVSDDALFWNFQVTEDAYGFDVTVKAVDPDSVLASAGMTLTDSQSSLLSGLLSGQAPASFDPLLAALNGADSASEAAKIVESFGPALAGAAGYATRVAGAGASNAISARMGETRGAASGDAFTKNAVWIKPFLGMASQDDTNGLSGYDVDTTGFVIGIDGDLNDNTRVGVAVASAQSDLEGGGVNLDIDTTQFTLYGSYALGAATSLDVDLSYGANGYDSRRRVSFAGSTAVADYDGTQLALGAAFSHRIAMSDKAALVPSLSVRYSKVELDGYSETGAAPFNLTVADSDDDAILALAKAGYELTLNNKGVFLANLGLGYDTVDQASATATVTSVGQTFVANGIEPDSTLIVGGIGYRYVTAKNLEINAAYDLESRSDFLGQTVSVKFRLPF